MRQETQHKTTSPNFFDSRGSLTKRLRLWTIAVFTITLAAFTTLDVIEERRESFRIETAHAQALLAHLSGMPEVRGTREAAAARIEPLRKLLGATGADVELVAAVGDGAAGAVGRVTNRTVLASQAVTLRDGTSRFVYSIDSEHARDAAARSIVIHTVHGFLALFALIAGFEWFLRRRLIAPLRTMTQQILLMRRGGWSPRLPAADQELQELNRAIGGLGPALEGQVHQWIEAERRIAMADVLRSLRRSLDESRRRAGEAAQELSTGHLVAPDGAKTMRSLLAHLDSIPKALDEEERRRFGRDLTWPATSAGPA